MIVMAKNYHYLINRFPSSGGVYTFVKNVFGYDHAFLVAWFLACTYGHLGAQKRKGAGRR